MIEPTPQCTQPATWRVEGYSTDKYGHAHGNLDVAVYACERHHQDARTQLVSDGWTIFSAPRPVPTPDDKPLCGTGFDYTTHQTLFGDHPRPAPEPAVPVDPPLDPALVDRYRVISKNPVIRTVRGEAAPDLTAAVRMLVDRWTEYALQMAEHISPAAAYAYRECADELSLILEPRAVMPADVAAQEMRAAAGEHPDASDLMDLDEQENDEPPGYEPEHP